MTYSIDKRFDGVARSHSLAKDLRDVWAQLYIPDGGACPERVRIGILHENDNVQAVFDGSYPAAILWTLRVWDTLSVADRLSIEMLLKQALCINGGGCKEEDDGEGD